jgi:hypothetical protein
MRKDEALDVLTRFAGESLLMSLWRNHDVRLRKPLLVCQIAIWP